MSVLRWIPNNFPDHLLPESRWRKMIIFCTWTFHRYSKLHCNISCSYVCIHQRYTKNYFRWNKSREANSEWNKDKTGRCLQGLQDSLSSQWAGNQLWQASKILPHTLCWKIGHRDRDMTPDVVVALISHNDSWSHFLIRDSIETQAATGTNSSR